LLRNVDDDIELDKRMIL